MAIDPICGMDVLSEEAAGTSRYRGVDYYFCAVGCKEAFDKSPGRYLSGSAVEAAPMKLLEIKPKQPEMVGSAKQIEIPIRGMSCASCVQRIENALLKTPGVVSADVNFAAERATVSYLPSVAEPGSFRKAIEEAGYRVADLAAASRSPDREEAAREAEISLLRTKFLVGSILSIPVLLGSFPDWFPWAPAVLSNPVVLLLLTTPVQFWVGWQFHRGFWATLKHRTADMNTLVSIGTNAAYFYSVALTFFRSTIAPKGMEAMTYYDTAAILMTLIVMGRWLEAKAKGRTSEAIKTLMGLQARTARVIRGGLEQDIPVEEVRAGDLVLVRPGEKVPVDGIIR
ncbi:MAG: actP, partial [candidate division NC10 bacterium]|nr:actP [candidate division NC10 bacterium]